jgi:Flp pilus assembly protein TadD
MPFVSTGRASLRRLLPVLTAASASLLLGACASVGNEQALLTNPPMQQSAAEAPPQSELQKATTYWGKQMAENPQDPRAALNYAKNLKAMGAKREALQTLQQAYALNQTDREIASEYGRLALEHDQISVAQKLLEQADDQSNPDWRVLSARGTVLAKQGKHNEAIDFYERAKELAPDQPSVLNNLAMAHAMAGQSGRAEGLLRQAAAKPDADKRVQQNLALVLGLNGKHDEARVAGADQLSPDASAQNADAVRKLVQVDQTTQDPVMAPVAAAAATRSAAKAGTKAASTKAAGTKAATTAAKLSTASVPTAKGQAKGKVAAAAEPEVDATELVRRLADGASSSKAP